MAEDSHISWTDHTWNPWIGCTKVSPACDGCYAENLMDKRFHKVNWGGTRERTGIHTWNDPYRWNRYAEKHGIRPFVFCASLADIFDNQVPPSWRYDAFKVMRETPHLVYLLLTKRPSMIVKLAAAAGGLPANAAIGTTVEDQQRADKNLWDLEHARIALNPLFTFGSFEPLLGRVSIPLGAMPSWVITGGETDQGDHMARPSHPQWFHDLRERAELNNAHYHHKQNGEWIDINHSIRREGDILLWPDGHIGEGGGGANEHLGPGYWMRKVGKKNSGRLLDGVEYNGFPAVRNV